VKIQLDHTPGDCVDRDSSDNAALVKKQNIGYSRPLYESQKRWRK